MILETQTRGGREMGGEKPSSWTQVPAWGLEEPERLQGLVENHIHHAEKALATPLQYSCLENLSDTEAW